MTATGVIEPGTFTFRVYSLEIAEAWKTKHAGVSFVPRLLPSLHADHKQPQHSGSNSELLICRICDDEL